MLIPAPQPPHRRPPPRQLVETSGAADASTLAAALAGGGFDLELVVCVVDAEAGADALRDEPIARSQVRWRGCDDDERRGNRRAPAAALAACTNAWPPHFCLKKPLTVDSRISPLPHPAQLLASDLVVLNKVDLAGLAATSDLEDAVRQLAPGARALRARFGQVPVEAVLDTAGRGGELAAAPPPQQQQQQKEETGSSTEAAASAQPSSVVGEVGFLSHEGPIHQQQRRGPSQQRPALVHRSGGWRRQQHLQQQQQDVVNGSKEHAHPDYDHSSSSHGHHAHAHANGHHAGSAASRDVGFETVSLAFDEGPLCMACYQLWVRQQLLNAEGDHRILLGWFLIPDSASASSQPLPTTTQQTH
jgi:G3E family GTPase